MATSAPNSNEWKRQGRKKGKAGDRSSNNSLGEGAVETIWEGPDIMGEPHEGSEMHSGTYNMGVKLGDGNQREPPYSHFETPTPMHEHSEAGRGGPNEKRVAYPSTRGNSRGGARTGGKGTMRRKKKAVHKTTTTDDKRLQSTLKRIGVNAIPAIEEVNIFKEDVVIQFVNPKVQASVAANTWVVSGTPQNKKLQDILPQIINQLGPDNLENLKKLAEQFQKQAPAASSGAAEDDDDDVPELVAGETFEAAAEEGQTQTS
ncbi:hypothetical protein SASPL_133406 [Salvia splendens]|uniref:Nascent polypeptide-associated complex subunit beta n=1 Tax=Salvia splendens TaxID=180675 RepID=A0A8X8ZI11_SALSN|nr:hypothetical protein SASPL_133406 [Salvia splendens]